MKSGRQHPVAADDVGVVFGDLVGGDRAPDAGVLAEDIVDLPFHDQAIPEEVFADKGIPQKHGVVLVEIGRLLPPAVVSAGIEFEPREGEDAQVPGIVLGPVPGRRRGIDGAAEIRVAEVRMNPEMIFIGIVQRHGKSQVAGIGIITAQQEVDKIHGVVIGETGVDTQVQRPYFSAYRKIQTRVFRAACIHPPADLSAQAVGIGLRRDAVGREAAIEACL